jgi:hypothetical protein
VPASDLKTVGSFLLVARDPGAVHCAPECGTRSAQDGVRLADNSLNHGSEWIGPPVAADDAVDQFVCHLRHLLCAEPG